jgi:hypothetical protein
VTDDVVTTELTEMGRRAVEVIVLTQDEGLFAGDFDDVLGEEVVHRFVGFFPRVELLVTEALDVELIP